MYVTLHCTPAYTAQHTTPYNATQQRAISHTKYITTPHITLYHTAPTLSKPQRTLLHHTTLLYTTRNHIHYATPHRANPIPTHTTRDTTLHYAPYTPPQPTWNTAPRHIRSRQPQPSTFAGDTLNRFPDPSQAAIRDVHDSEEPS